MWSHFKPVVLKALFPRSLSNTWELLETYILRSLHRPLEWETLENEAEIGVFTNTFHDFAAANVWQPLL